MEIIEHSALIGQLARQVRDAAHRAKGYPVIFRAEFIAAVLEYCTALANGFAPKEPENEGERFFYELLWEISEHFASEEHRTPILLEVSSVIAADLKGSVQGLVSKGAATAFSALTDRLLDWAVYRLERIYQGGVRAVFRRRR